MKILFLSLFLLGSLCASELTQKLEAILEQYGLPGLAAAHYKNGELVSSAAVGVRKLGTENKLRFSDKFHIGSCAKAMSAALFGVLVDEGKLSWNTKVKEVLNDSKLDPDFSDIEIERFLFHSAGIQPNYEGLDRDWAMKTFFNESVNPLIARSRLATYVLTKIPHHSKDQFLYSNSGYAILGHLLEKRTGKTYRELMREMVFNPLGMTSCGFGPLGAQEDEPWGHKLIGDKLEPIISDNPPVFSPAGTIHCSLSDWAKFLNEQALAIKGESKVFSELTTKKLHQKAVFMRKDKVGDIHYTYGAWQRVKRSWNKGYLLNHTGSNTMNYATVWFAPEENNIYLAVTNAAPEVKVEDEKLNFGAISTNSAIGALLQLNE